MSAEFGSWRQSLRLDRRTLVNALFDLLTYAPAGVVSTQLVLSEQAPERAYQFVISPKGPDQSFEEYRERRTALLAAYCHVAKVKRPELLDIIGLATEPIDVDKRSEDLVYLDGRLWTDEDEAKTRELQAHTGILVNPSETPFHDDEYPEPIIAPPRVISSTEGLVGNRKQRRARQAALRRASKHQPG